MCRVEDLREVVCADGRMELLLCIIRMHRRCSLLLCAGFRPLNNIAETDKCRGMVCVVTLWVFLHKQRKTSCTHI